MSKFSQKLDGEEKLTKGLNKKRKVFNSFLFTFNPQFFKVFKFKSSNRFTKFNIYKD